MSFNPSMHGGVLCTFTALVLEEVNNRHFIVRALSAVRRKCHSLFEYCETARNIGD